MCPRSEGKLRTELTAIRYGRQVLLFDRSHPVRALTLTDGQRYYRQASQPLLAPPQ